MRGEGDTYNFYSLTDVDVEVFMRLRSVARLQYGINMRPPISNLSPVDEGRVDSTTRLQYVTLIEQGFLSDPSTYDLNEEEEL